MDRFLKPVCALLIGGSAGAGFAMAHAPVPWLIGPLLTVAICNLLGAGFETPKWLRSTGQWLIGVTLGLHFTRAMIGEISDLLPYMVLAALLAIAFGLVGSWAMSKFGNVDRATAHFATAMGGAPEMAVAAERSGASIDQVVTAHMIRVLLTVSIVPAAVQFGAQLTPHVPAHASTLLPTVPLVLLGALALGCALLGRRINFPNAYALIPLFVSAGLCASDIVPLGHVPRWISVVAQVLVAVSLGVRFSPDSLAASRRLLVPIVVYSLSCISFAALAGIALARLTGVPTSTAILSLAPGGMADMGIAADSLGLAVPVVTGFHVIRVAIVVLLSWPAYRCISAWRLHKKTDGFQEPDQTGREH